MKVIKFATKNLTCYHCIDVNGIENYQIFENENNRKPVAIYVNRDDLRLSDSIPVPEPNYKYFKELCEIINLLINMEE